METVRSGQPKGRPRSFDADEALGKALEVFWRKGYEGASLPDLTEAMGINRPSMYAAFGNKEALFRKALDRYLENTRRSIEAALSKPTSREAVEHLFDTSLACASKQGCLLVQGALACSDDAQPIQQELATQRMANELAMRERFERAKAEGDLPADSDPADLARYIATIQNGISVQLSGGATVEQLKRVVEVVLEGWPGK